MRLCTNRPEGFGPQSHVYSHILTSCFLDTILVPLCTWLYLLALFLHLTISAIWSRGKFQQNPDDHGAIGFRPNGKAADVDMDRFSDANRRPRRSRTHLSLYILYMLLLVAQTLMCVLEIVRLSLAHLGIGLLPFTFVTLIMAAALRLGRGYSRRVRGWRWINFGAWVALAVTNGVKIAEEVREGSGQRKGSKYPESDEITDVSVMVGVYTALAILEVLVQP